MFLLLTPNYFVYISGTFIRSSYCSGFSHVCTIERDGACKFTQIESLSLNLISAIIILTCRSDITKRAVVKNGGD